MTLRVFLLSKHSEGEGDNLNLRFNNINELGYFTKIFKRLFEDLSTNPLPLRLEGYPSNLKPYIDSVYYNTEYEFANSTQGVVEFNVKNSKEVIVAFSGGKDSLAVTIELIRQGYNPTLLHFKGINKGYTNEIDIARKLANKLNLKLIVIDVTYDGKIDYAEHPIKNQLILSTMIDYGIKLGICNFSMGNHTDDDLATSNMNFNWSDANEMFSTSLPFFKEYMTNLNYLQILKNSTNAFKIISESNQAEIIEEVISCILPYRFRGHIKKVNENKYNIKLMENRCGSCQKCASEYIHLVYFGIIEKNDDFF